MMQRIRKAMQDKDQGFTLIELLVVIIIIGILAAIAIPVFLNQRTKAADAAVVSDLKDLAIGAETSFTDALAYPSDAAGFATNGTAPQVTTKTHYKAFVSATGTTAGYVIFGYNDNGAKVYELSSYEGGAPTVIGDIADWATLAVAPSAGTYGTDQPDLSGVTAISIDG